MAQNRTRRRAQDEHRPRARIYPAYFTDTFPLPDGNTGIVVGIGPEDELPRAALGIDCTEQLDHLVAELLELRYRLRCAGPVGEGLSNSPFPVKK
jgi:hypothetical protein